MTFVAASLSRPSPTAIRHIVSSVLWSNLRPSRFIPLMRNMLSVSSHFVDLFVDC